MPDIIDDLTEFSDQEIAAMTFIGESESKGERGMQGTACSIQNRMAANVGWMGGNNVRSVCLARNQYDCWWPQTDNADRQRIIDIAKNNPSYPAYLTALGIAASLLAGDLVDFTNGAVSYGDDGEKPVVKDGSEPCFIDGDRQYFNLDAVM